MTRRPRIATTSLAGCFGCHMSLLDLDMALVDLLQRVELDRTPLTDVKTLGHCDIGLIEGAVANAENVELLREFRARCDLLVAVGACAINGGIPSLRNAFSVEECLAESYLDGIGLDKPCLPDDPELPKLLRQVHPIGEVVTVDYDLPGCPPSAELIGWFLGELLEGRSPELPPSMIRYD